MHQIARFQHFTLLSYVEFLNDKRGKRKTGDAAACTIN